MSFRLLPAWMDADWGDRQLVRIVLGACVLVCPLLLPIWLLGRLAEALRGPPR